MIELVYATPHDITTLEPTQASGWADHTAALAIFGALVLNFDGRTGAHGYFPWLAQSVEPRGDLCWEIVLRPGLLFHDGTPLNAAALKFSLDRIRDVDFPSRRFLHSAPISHVETEGELLVRVHTSEPIASFPARLLRADAAPVSPSCYSSDPTPTVFDPIGAGPFRFADYIPGDRLVLDVNHRFEDPRCGRPPDFDRLILRTITSAERLLEEMAAHQVDIAPIPADMADRVSALTGWRVVAGSDTSRVTFEINQTAHPALADRRVRQALNHAVDVERLRTQMTGGQGQRIAALVNPPNADPAIQPYAFDPDRSRALLQEAGYPQGFPLCIDWSASPEMGRIAEAMVPYLGAVGIEVTAITRRDWATEYQAGQVAGTLGGLHGHGHAGVEMTAETDLWPLHPEREANSTNWTGPEARRFAALYGELQQTTDAARQCTLGNELQAITHDEAVSIPFWRQPRLVAVNARVGHFLPYPGGHNEDFWAIRMATASGHEGEVPS